MTQCTKTKTKTKQNGNNIGKTSAISQTGPIVQVSWKIDHQVRKTIRMQTHQKKHTQNILPLSQKQTFVSDTKNKKQKTTKTTKTN